jgi:glutamyl-tRNA(Gln) amidotransferase subunit E
MRPIPSLHETNPALYQELGMISGVEIHQQLHTRRKLFCRCPAGRYSSHVDAEVLRHMRPTLSELGEYDGTALMEFKTRKEIVYQLNSETVCTYEMDDTPPFMIDEAALDIALELTMLLRCNLVGELHIARKQYLDGSIPTGFQRTTLCGTDGYIHACGRRIGIIQLGLEEDACRQVSDVGHVRVYRTDRLGMPLIEMVTYPEMVLPGEVAEVTESLRRLARSTGKVRTGHGATRQDVNVSVEGGTRCEIKGVPSIRMIPRLVHHEAFRQRGLLDLRDELAARGHTPEAFETNTADVTSVLERTPFLPLAQAIEAGGVCSAVRLPGFAGTLGWPLQPDITFAKELSDRVRVIACLDHLPNLLHTDQLDLILTSRKWAAVRREVRAGSDDAVILVWGSPQDVQTAAAEIEIRAREAIEGVPNETRRAHWDGTTDFERILPGADRMYPDTDLPPKEVTPERIERIQALLGDPPWEMVERIEEAGISRQLAWALTNGAWSSVFEESVAAAVPPSTAATVLANIVPGLARRGVDPPPAAHLQEMLAALRDGSILLDAVPSVLRRMARGATWQEAAETLGMVPVGADEVEPRVETALAGVQRGALREGGEPAVREVMGQVMAVLRGKVAGSRVRPRVEAWLGGER